jgi:hypothetical protein
MTTLVMDADTLGPVDVVVIGFAGNAFHGEIALLCATWSTAR